MLTRLCAWYLRRKGWACVSPLSRVTCSPDNWRSEMKPGWGCRATYDTPLMPHDVSIPADLRTEFRYEFMPASEAARLEASGFVRVDDGSRAIERPPLIPKSEWARGDDLHATDVARPSEECERIIVPIEHAAAMKGILECSGGDPWKFAPYIEECMKVGAARGDVPTATQRAFTLDASRGVDTTGAGKR